MVKAANRIDYLLSDWAPLHTDIHNSYFAVPSTQEVLTHHSSRSVVWMENTLLYRRVRPFAFSRDKWVRLLHKPKLASFS